jgi:hypothetical protein
MSSYLVLRMESGNQRRDAAPAWRRRYACGGRFAPVLDRRGMLSLAMQSGHFWRHPEGLASDETHSSAPMPNSRLLSAEGHVCPHTAYVRASQTTRTNLCLSAAESSGASITTSAACTTSSASGLGTPARCRSRARLGLKDRVADQTFDATARQSANPPDPTLFVRPGTRSLVEMSILQAF